MISKQRQRPRAPRTLGLTWLLAIAWCASAHGTEPTWIVMETEHFQVYSSASERATRQMLGQFERVRGFFVQASKTATGSAYPVAVLIFGTAKEYQPFRWNTAADAYYTKRGDHDFIVMGSIDDHSAMTASHE